MPVTKRKTTKKATPLPPMKVFSYRMYPDEHAAADKAAQAEYGVSIDVLVRELILNKYQQAKRKSLLGK